MNHIDFMVVILSLTEEAYYFMTEMWDLLLQELWNKRIVRIIFETTSQETSITPYLMYAISSSRMMSIFFRIRRICAKNELRFATLSSLFNHLTRNKKRQSNMDDIPTQLIGQSHENYWYNVFFLLHFFWIFSRSAYKNLEKGKTQKEM